MVWETKYSIDIKSFVLAMQRLLAFARALASDDGSSASIAEPLHDAEEDHATIRNDFDVFEMQC